MNKITVLTALLVTMSVSGICNAGPWGKVEGKGVRQGTGVAEGTGIARGKGTATGTGVVIYRDKNGKLRKKQGTGTVTGKGLVIGKGALAGHGKAAGKGRAFGHRKNK